MSEQMYLICTMYTGSAHCHLSFLQAEGQHSQQHILTERPRHMLRKKVMGKES